MKEKGLIIVIIVLAVVLIGGEDCSCGVWTDLRRIPMPRGGNDSSSILCSLSFSQLLSL